MGRHRTTVRVGWSPVQETGECRVHGRTPSGTGDRTVSLPSPGTPSTVTGTRLVPQGPFLRPSGPRRRPFPPRVFRRHRTPDAPRSKVPLRVESGNMGSLDRGRKRPRVPVRLRDPALHPRLDPVPGTQVDSRRADSGPTTTRVGHGARSSESEVTRLLGRLLCVTVLRADHGERGSFWSR